MYKISCNKCGKSLEIPAKPTYNDLCLLNTFKIIPLRFNYGSKFDMLHTTLVLCDDCLGFVFNECVLPVTWREQKIMGYND